MTSIAITFDGTVVGCPKTIHSPKTIQRLTEQSLGVQRRSTDNNKGRVDVKESDWKVLRSLKDALLERFCQLTLVGAEQIIRDARKSQHARYLELFSLIEKDDKALGLTFDGLSRSNGLTRLAFMHHAGLLTEDEFARFSPEAHEQVIRIQKGLERE